MKKKYRYVKYKNIICRFEMIDDKSYNSIGEIFNCQDNKWIRSLNSMEYDMSGVFTQISEKDVVKFVTI